jgi:hypothetical protein
MSVFRLIPDRIRRKLSNIADRSVLTVSRLRFHLLFKNIPARGEYCNSRRIDLRKRITEGERYRPYLAVIRCGAKHCLIDDRSPRNFDIALNLYASPVAEGILENCEYLYAGGINKYKAACQFIDCSLLSWYRGFIFLDDDVEITYSDLARFLEYCWVHGFGLAQPSVSAGPFTTHKQHLINASRSGWRAVSMVEVMCPYFSSDALRIALNTFDLSYSTWGLDLIWPRLFDFEPVVVDEFTIDHTKPVGGPGNAFYRYMRSIGISPEREMNKLMRISDERVRTIVSARPDAG